MMKILRRSVHSLVGLKRKYNHSDLKNMNLDVVVQSRFFPFIGSVQNERAAGIVDTVQRGLGMLPQQAKFLDFLIGENQGIA